MRFRNFNSGFTDCRRNILCKLRAWARDEPSFEPEILELVSPEFISPEGSQASRGNDDAARPREEAIAIHFSEMKAVRPEAVRATYVFQALQRAGRALRGGGSDFYHLSHATTRLHAFWSHSWHGNKWMKVATLLFLIPQQLHARSLVRPSGLSSDSSGRSVQLDKIRQLCELLVPSCRICSIRIGHAVLAQPAACFLGQDLLPSVQPRKEGGRHVQFGGDPEKCRYAFGSVGPELRAAPVVFVPYSRLRILFTFCGLGLLIYARY